MRRILLVVALAALAALAGCGGLGEGASVALEAEGERRPAPAVSVPSLGGGEPVALAEHRGRPVVLNFWASWCAPCRDEMPELVRFAREHPDIDVVALAVSDRPDDSRRFARETGVTFDVGIDRRGEVAGDFGVTGLPVTVVLDREGRIAATWTGPIGREELEAYAAELGA